MQERDQSMQLKELDSVYKWYFKKLEKLGMLTSGEIEEEDNFNNPDKVEAKKAEKEKYAEHVRKLYADPVYAQEQDMKYFEKEERTIHNEIPPAKDRLMSYKRKGFDKRFEFGVGKSESVDKFASAKQMKQRPFSGASAFT